VLRIAKVFTEPLTADAANIPLKFVKQPVALEQAGVRESLVTYITCHHLSDVLHRVMKLE
jgi:hypothetical protein